MNDSMIGHLEKKIISTNYLQKFDIITVVDFLNHKQSTKPRGSSDFGSRCDSSRQVRLV